MKRLYIFLLSISLPICGVGAQVKPISDPALMNILYTQGVESYLTGNLHYAVNRFEVLTQTTADAHTPSLYYLSRISFESADTTKALEYIERALAVEPDNLVYLRLQGQILLEKNALVEADSVLQKILRINPEDRQTRILSILCVYFEGHRDQAIRQINDFEKRYGFEDRLSQIKKQYYISTMQLEDLLDYAERLSAIDPSTGKFIMLAQTQAAMGLDSAALENYERAMDVSGGNDLQARMALADYWRVKGDSDKMRETAMPVLISPEITSEAKIEVIKEIIRMERNPASEIVKEMMKLVAQSSEGDRDIILSYVQYLAFLGDYQGAAYQMNTLYDRGILDVKEKMFLAQLYGQLDQLDKSLEIAQKVLKTSIGDPLMSPLAIYILSRYGRFKEALDISANYIKKAENDSIRSSAYGVRGDLYYQMNQSNKSYGDYKRALKYNPDNALVLNNYAYHLAVHGKNLDEALRMTNKANDLSLQNPTYLDTKAWVLYKMGRIADAKHYILLTIGLYKEPSAEVFLHAGDILEAAGEKESARIYWKRAAESGATNEEMGDRLNR